MQEWYVFSRSHGQRAMWDAIGEGDRDAVKSVAGQHLESARAADGRIRLRQQVRCTSAASA